MDGKVVLITGATKNTGYAAARRFAREGWNVCVTSRDEASAKEAAARLQAEFPRGEFLGAGMELDSVPAIRAAFARIAERFGRLDAFVANAAHLGVDYNVFNMTQERWDAVMNANARGSFFCAQAAVPLMEKAGGGAIVFVSSVHANQSIAGRVAYSASKAAINATMRCLAVELGHLHIRVNSIIAGAIWTERWAQQPAEVAEKRRAQYPAGKESSPEDIAAAIYFLCSDQSPTITGTELTVDSGISVCLLPYQKDWRQGESAKNAPSNALKG